MNAFLSVGREMPSEPNALIRKEFKSTIEMGMIMYYMYNEDDAM